MSSKRQSISYAVVTGIVGWQLNYISTQSRCKLGGNPVFPVKILKAVRRSTFVGEISIEIVRVFEDAAHT